MSEEQKVKKNEGTKELKDLWNTHQVYQYMYYLNPRNR